ncbi:hypothetical protein D3C78_421250 [compost metagenome]
MEIMRNKMLRAFFTKHFNLFMLELFRRIPLKPREVKQIGWVLMRRSTKRSTDLPPITVITAPHTGAPCPVHRIQSSIFVFHPITKSLAAYITMTIKHSELIVCLPANHCWMLPKLLCHLFNYAHTVYF